MSKAIATLFIFASESNGLKSYQTLLYVDGTTSCDCPGWKFKKKTTADGARTCRHTRMIEAGIARMNATKTVEYEAVTAPQRKEFARVLPKPIAARKFDFAAGTLKH